MEEKKKKEQRKKMMNSGSAQKSIMLKSICFSEIESTRLEPLDTKLVSNLG